ncbi:MAG: pyrimidine/purine nucleoside phosphorylase [Spirochaetota bacterium]
MIKVNEYFDGAVKSLGFQSAEGPATAGVMEKGEYEFGTSTQEIMTVITGRMRVLLPNASEWKEFTGGQSFIVEKNQKFQLKVESDSAYLCLYK